MLGKKSLFKHQIWVQAKRPNICSEDLCLKFIANFFKSFSLPCYRKKQNFANVYNTRPHSVELQVTSIRNYLVIRDREVHPINALPCHC
jgi:hypothetical protein